MDDSTTTVCVARVRGRVQGVGFRWWARDQMSRLGLAGQATNLRDGSVELVARGDPRAVDTLLELLRSPRAPGRIDSIEVDRDGNSSTYV